MPMYWQLKRWKTVDRERTIDHLFALRKALAKAVPQRTSSDTLLLATWNVRDFDSNKFGQGPRLAESFHYLAEVIAASASSNPALPCLSLISILCPE